MSRSALMLRVLWIVLLLVGKAFGDAAEEYRSYVERVVPATFQLAEQNARVREAMIGAATMAEVQVALNEVAATLEKFKFYATEIITQLEDPRCPLIQDTLDVPATLKQLTIVSLALRYWNNADRRLSAIEKVDEERAGVCEAKNAFEAYRVSQLPFRFYMPPEISTFDGVYFAYSTGDYEERDGKKQESKVKDEEKPLMYLPLISSIYSIFKNEGIRKELAELRGQLMRDMVQDSHYRDRAKMECIAFRKLTEPQFEAYRSIVRAGRKVLAELSELPLQNRISFLNNCIHSYEGQYRDFVERNARRKTSKALAERVRETDRIKQSIEIHQRVGGNLALIRTMNCESNEVPKALDAIRRDEILYRLQGNTEPSALITSAQQAAQQWRAKCEPAE